MFFTIKGAATSAADHDTVHTWCSMSASATGTTSALSDHVVASLDNTDKPMYAAVWGVTGILIVPLHEVL